MSFILYPTNDRICFCYLKVKQVLTDSQGARSRVPRLRTREAACERIHRNSQHPPDHAGEGLPCLLEAHALVEAQGTVRQKGSVRDNFTVALVPGKVEESSHFLLAGETAAAAFFLKGHLSLGESSWTQQTQSSSHTH